MAWMIQSNSEGPVIIADMGLTFTAKQIRNIDLIGRHNAERSSDLKLMMQKGFLKEIAKDASEDGFDPKAIKELNENVLKSNENAKQAQQMAVTHQQDIKDLQTQNVELKKQNEELHSKMDFVVAEVKAFAEKFPGQVKIIAEAMRNIQVEQTQIAVQREALPQSGESDKEIRMQEKILGLREKKLEKNIKNLGSTISESATDFKESLDALDQLGL